MATTQHYDVNLTATPADPSPAPAPAPPAPRSLVTHAVALVIGGLLAAVGGRITNQIPTIPPPPQVAEVRITNWPDAVPAPIPVPVPPVPVDPTPAPTPKPAPGPTPAPIVSGILHATLILDHEDMTQQQAMMRYELTVGHLLGEWNVVPREHAIRSPELKTAGLTPFVKKTPCVIFQEDIPGEPHRAPVVDVIYPETTDDIVKACKKLRGLK